MNLDSGQSNLNEVGKPNDSKSNELKKLKESNESNDETQELPSFDISDNFFDGSYNGDLDLSSTPEINSSNDRNTDEKSLSKLSNDLFGTPRTIDTRTSTMTSSNFEFNPKFQQSELLIQSAMKQEIKTDNTSNKSVNQPTTSITKRLSRQSNYEISVDTDTEIGDYNSFRNSLPPYKTEINKNHNDILREFNGPDMIPSITEIIKLQNELTNCKVQIKIQNDFLRKMYNKNTENSPNKEELSLELEKQIANSISSSNYKTKLEILKVEYDSLKQNHNMIVKENENIINQLEATQLSHQEQIKSQLELKERINKLLQNNKLTVVDEVKDEDNDVIHLLDNHMKSLTKENLELKHIVDVYIKDLKNSQKKVQDLSTQLKDKDQSVKELQSEIGKKVKESESINANYEFKISSFEETYQSLMTKFSNLKLEYDTLKIRLNELNKNNQSLKKRNEELELKVNETNKIIKEKVKENHSLRKLNESATMEFKLLLENSSSFHAILINILTKLIDPTTSGDLLEEIKNIDNEANFENIFKVFSVTQNYEIEALSDIIENYTYISEKMKTESSKSDKIIDLKSQITTLTSKLHSLEKHNDLERIKIQELENENSKLKLTLSHKSNRIDELKKLRLEDLSQKWKTAEVALSQSKRGAQLKISELELELNKLVKKFDSL